MTDVQLGLRANAAQFSLLVGLNALVGALVGLGQVALDQRLVRIDDGELVLRQAAEEI